MNQIDKVMPVLNKQWLIETQLHANISNSLRSSTSAGNLLCGVSRQNVQQEEGDERDSKKNERRLQQASANIADHQDRPRCVGSNSSRSASPRRLNASASMTIATPGRKTSQGAVAKYD